MVSYLYQYNSVIVGAILRNTAIFISGTKRTSWNIHLNRYHSMVIYNYSVVFRQLSVPLNELLHDCAILMTVSLSLGLPCGSSFLVAYISQARHANCVLTHHTLANITQPYHSQHSSVARNIMAETLSGSQGLSINSLAPWRSGCHIENFVLLSTLASFLP